MRLEMIGTASTSPKPAAMAISVSSPGMQIPSLAGDDIAERAGGEDWLRQISVDC
jgi:hypothetical protein